MGNELSKFVESNEELKKFNTKKKEILDALECKICRVIPSASTPKVMVLCCNQIIGCRGCLSHCMQESPLCPLCCSDAPNPVVVNSLDPLYDFFSQVD